MELHTITLLRKPQQGFSLIELIIVIVLIGILAVYIAPRFSDKSGFADYATQDLIISAARLAQQRAMYNHSRNACYRMNISSGTIYIESYNGSSYTRIGPAGWRDGVEIDSSVSLADSIAYFDALGNVLDNTALCAGSPQTQSVLISGGSGLKVCLFSTGHIQAQVSSDACP